MIDGEGETPGEDDGDGDGVADGLGDAFRMVNWNEHVPTCAAFGIDFGTFGAVGVLPLFSRRREIEMTATARMTVRIFPPKMSKDLNRRCSIGFIGFIDFPSWHIHWRYMVDTVWCRRPMHSRLMAMTRCCLRYLARVLRMLPIQSLT